MDSPVASLLIEYRYAVLVPLALVEGHLVSLAAGFLSRMGFLEAVPAGALIALGNLLGDAVFYWLGFAKGEALALGWGRYAGLDARSLERARRIYRRRSATILFVSKITNGFGLAPAVLFTAGMFRIPFKTYMAWNFLGECIWTSTLVSIGYGFGRLYAAVDFAAWIAGLATALALAWLAVMAARRYFTENVRP